MIEIEQTFKERTDELYELFESDGDIFCDIDISDAKEVFVGVEKSLKYISKRYYKLVSYKETVMTHKRENKMIEESEMNDAIRSFVRLEIGLRKQLDARYRALNFEETKEDIMKKYALKDGVTKIDLLLKSVTYLETLLKDIINKCSEILRFKKMLDAMT